MSSAVRCTTYQRRTWEFSIRHNRPYGREVGRVFRCACARRILFLFTVNNANGYLLGGSNDV